MNRIFVTSDTHFGHRRVLEFEPFFRPFRDIYEHDEELIRRWNDTVGPKDTVWHLGDVLFGRQNFPLLSRLNGIKKLVLGNHDQYPMEEYQKYFTKIVGGVVLDGFILTHIPIHPSQFYRFKANVHGHLHSNLVEENHVVDRRYINVSVEQTGLKPVMLVQLLNSWRDKYGRN